MKLDFCTGVIEGLGVVHSQRTLSDLGNYYANKNEIVFGSEIVYETYTLPNGRNPDVLVATTVLHPGRVGNEFWMTRGHFHIDPSRGENCVTLSGNGVMLLANRSGEHMVENMAPGDVLSIDGEWAHRAVNVGVEPLIFLVSWMSDCGHDYESIERDGFPVRILANGSGWRLSKGGEVGSSVHTRRT